MYRQAQYRIVHAIKLRCAFAVQEFIEGHRIIRRFSFAMRADDDQQVLNLLQAVRFKVTHRDQRHFDTAAFQLACHLFRQLLAVAGL